MSVRDGIYQNYYLSLFSVSRKTYTVLVGT